MNVSLLHLVQQFGFRSQVCIHASRTFMSTGLVQHVFCMSSQNSRSCWGPCWILLPCSLSLYKHLQALSVSM